MTQTAQIIVRNAMAMEPINRFVLASFRTLRRHKQSGAFDQYAALRLLRNNARDIAPPAAPLSDFDRDAIARYLLMHWRLHWLPNADKAGTQSTE